VPNTVEFQLKLWIANLDNMRSVEPELPMDDFVNSLNAYNLQFMNFVVVGLLERPCWNVISPVVALLTKVGEKYPPLLPPLGKAIVAVHTQHTAGGDEPVTDLGGLKLSQMPTLYMSKLYTSFLASREARRLQTLTSNSMPTEDKLKLIDAMLESTMNEEHAALLKFGKTFLTLQGSHLMKWLLEDTQERS
jgi:hypothetical protein